MLLFYVSLWCRDGTTRAELSEWGCELWTFAGIAGLRKPSAGWPMICPTLRQSKSTCVGSLGTWSHRRASLHVRLFNDPAGLPKANVAQIHVCSCMLQHHMYTCLYMCALCMSACLYACMCVWMQYTCIYLCIEYIYTCRCRCRFMYAGMYG